MPARLWPPRRSSPGRSAPAAARDLTVVARGGPRRRRPRRCSAVRSPPRPRLRCRMKPGTAASTLCAARPRRRTIPGTWCWWMATNWPPAVRKACSRSSTGRRSAARTTTCRRPSATVASAPVVASLVLAWDRDKFPGHAHWSDFWDVAKYPGKRGLISGVRGNLEIRADRRRRRARRRLQGAGHLRRRGPRVPQAGSAQALHRVVAGRRRGGAYPGLGRRADVQRPRAADRHGEPDRAPQFRRAMERQPLRGGELGDPEGQSEPAPGARSSCISPACRRSRRGWSALFGEGGLAKGANDGLPPELLQVSPTTPGQS